MMCWERIAWIAWGRLGSFFEVRRMVRDDFPFVLGDGLKGIFFAFWTLFSPSEVVFFVEGGREERSISLALVCLPL